MQVYGTLELATSTTSSIMKHRTLDQNTLLISGGKDPTSKAINNCYTYNISTDILERKENMNEGRADHGL